MINAAPLSAPRLTDEQFAAFCAEQPELFFEMTAEGRLIASPPVFTLTDIRNCEIIAQLDRWSERDGRGMAGGSSGGFVLSNGARRSPDASWTSRDAIARLSKESLEGFWHLCPALVIELRSHSDRLRTVREKMREYIANGAELGWLIDPEARTVEVYRPERQPELHEGIESIEGESPVQGFTLDLRKVWEPLA